MKYNLRDLPLFPEVTNKVPHAFIRTRFGVVFTISAYSKTSLCWKASERTENIHGHAAL